MWKKIAETNDLVSIEKETPFSYKVRIEARMNKGYWQVFKTYFTDNEVALTEEYTTETKPDALNILTELKREKDMSPSELKSVKKLLEQKLIIKVERAFKEYEVEKWQFSINNDALMNFATVRYCEYIGMDIVMHEKYRVLERKILEELISVLGLKEFGLDIFKNIYFFNKRTFYKSKPKRKGVIISKIETDFGGLGE